MDLAERLYGDCSRTLAKAPQQTRVRTRGAVRTGGAIRTSGAGIGPIEPLIWESILLSIHFLCVVHALDERGAFKTLASAWGKLLHRKRQAAELQQLHVETKEALKRLEARLYYVVITPSGSDIEAARKAVQTVLEDYLGPQAVPETAAATIVSQVAANLHEPSGAAPLQS